MRRVIFNLLWISGFLALTSIAAVQKDSRHGPTSKKEAVFLWEQGSAAFQQGDWKEAIRLLQRLTDRYPGTKGYLNSHYHLGRAYYETRQYSKAIKKLRYYIEAQGLTVKAYEAKVLLANAYLMARKKTEALLLAREVIENKHGVTLPHVLLVQALLVKGWALIQFNNDNQATEALDSIRIELRSVTGHLSLQSGVFRLELELKLRQCQSLVAATRISESQVIELLKERSICLLEGLVLFRKVVKTGNQPSSMVAENAIISGIQDYRNKIFSPPPPPQKLSRIQKKRYRDELVNFLLDDFELFRDKAVQLLNTWETEFKSQSGNKKHFQSVQSFLSRISHDRHPG